MTPDQIGIILKRISRHDDEKAFRDLFDMYHGKLVEVAKFYVKDHFSAQEIAAEVFIKLWKNRATLDKVTNVGSYLFIATKRQALNYIRDHKKRVLNSIEEKEVNIFINARTPEKILISKEFTEVLKEAIQDLPSKCRLVYSLVKDDGMKYQEVADTLNISVKTVEMHVGKALKRIKIVFTRYQK